MQKLKIRLWAFFFILYLTLPAHAGMMENIAKDFTPFTAYVAAVTAQGDYVIAADKDASFAVGDIFQVFAKGESLMHPVSGEKIGETEKPLGALKVTRLQSTFAYARALGPVEKIKRGQKIRRFEGISAFFSDTSGKEGHIAAELRKTLPFLNWQSAQHLKKNPETASLHFIVKNQRLEVRDSESDMIQTYSLPPVSGHSADRSGETKEIPPKKTGISPAVFAPEYQQYKTIGKFSERIVSADFLPQKPGLLLAAAGTSRIRLFRVDETMEELNSISLSPRKIQMLKWWRPSEKESPYLAVTAWDENQIASEIFTLDGNRLVSAEKYIPYILGSFDRDGDGSAETLLGQNFDRDIVWGKRIRQMFPEGDSIKSKAADFSLPPDFTVTGSTFADLTGDGVQETICIRGNTLKIFSGREKLFETSGIGGSVSALTYETSPEQLASIRKTVRFEISPIVADFGQNSGRTLVVSGVNESMLSVSPLYSGFRNARLLLFQYQDKNFIRGTIGEELQMPVQGMAVRGKRIFFIQSPPASITSGDRVSHLCAYDITADNT